MRRSLLFDLLAGISLLIFGLTVAIWGWSYHHTENQVLQSVFGPQYYASRGQFIQEKKFDFRPLGPDEHVEPLSPPTGKWFLGIGIIRGQEYQRPAFLKSIRLVNYRTFVFPLRYVILMSAILPVVWGWVWYVQLRKLEAGEIFPHG